ncbi:MAG: nucleotide exchange factor GrpE [Clostridia bacterium]|nr:nucleotide exchange factor GrpE [Clostridia bacterium]
MSAEEKVNKNEEIKEEIKEEKNEETTEEIQKSEEDLLKEEIEQLKDKMIRHAAEFDNFKKRTAKEREELYAMSVCDTVEKILPIKDNLERATTAAEETESGILDGVKMILKQLDEALTSLGVEKIKTIGEEFNPELHNAVMHEENEAFSENTVSEEMMSGYTCKGRVVRHAMVKVAN